MSNALRFKSYKRAIHIQDKIDILVARYIHDLGRKPKQFERDQLEQLALLRIAFENVVCKMENGYDLKREFVALVNQYQLLAEKIFGKKAPKVDDNKDDAWD